MNDLRRERAEDVFSCAIFPFFVDGKGGWDRDSEDVLSCPVFDNEEGETTDVFYVRFAPGSAVVINSWLQSEDE